MKADVYHVPTIHGWCCVLCLVTFRILIVQWEVSPVRPVLRKGQLRRVSTLTKVTELVRGRVGIHTWSGSKFQAPNCTFCPPQRRHRLSLLKG